MSKLKSTVQNLKLFIPIFTLFIIHYSLFAPTAFAQTSTSSAIPAYVSPVSPLYTDLLVNNLFHSFSCLAVGQSVIGQPCLSYQITQNAQGMVQSVPVLSQVNTSGGVLGTATSLIGMLYTNPPVRTVDYIGSLGEQFGVIKTANAQVTGSGAAVLNPILKLWQVSRNISYVFMIIIFVIIGIMIMFRHKINPQTVITAQAALPGLVIGLIMITFSYFLAGLISDMAFVGTNVVGYYFSAVNPKASPDLVGQMNGNSVIKTFGDFLSLVDRGQLQQALDLVYNSMSLDIQNQLSWFASIIAFQFISPLGGVAGPFAAIASPIVGILGGLTAKTNPTFVLGTFLYFVVIAILIFAMLKLLLRLVNSYLTIIFLTITAPFQLLFAALPGRQGIATGWIMNMLANILIFPAVIAVFYFVAYILEQNVGPFIVANAGQTQNTVFIHSVSADGETNSIAANSIVGKDSFPLFGGMNLGFIKLILAFGALMALPSIPDIVVKSVGKASQAGELIGREIGGSVRSGQGYITEGVGKGSQGLQSIGTGVTGERTFYKRPDGGFDVVTQKPGLLSYYPNRWKFWRKPTLKSAPESGEPL